MSISNVVPFFELIEWLLIFIFEELPTIVGRIGINYFRRKSQRIISQIYNVTVLLFVFFITRNVC